MGKNKIDMNENIRKLEEVLEKLDKGEVVLSEDMFYNKNDFELVIRDLRKYIVSEIKYQKNRLKEELYKEFKEDLDE